LNPIPVKKSLLETLRRTGPMTFEHYMTFCLYHPEFGYYLQGRERTGVTSDYFQFRSAPDSACSASLAADGAIE
jgi:SAM-dependent MidA family methyltransferase